MASIYYQWIWNDLMNGSSVYREIYGWLLWATLPNMSNISYSNAKMSWETSFDVWWFQPWHSVLWLVTVMMSGSDSGSFEVNSYIQYYDWMWRSTWALSKWTWTLSANQVYKMFMPVWILSNQIRPDYWTQYRMYTTWKVWSYTWTDKIINFTVSNLNADSTIYAPWRIKVDWSNLIYTDTYWFKHIVAYDGSYDWSYVWSSKAWHLRLDPNVVRRLYYVDEYWYVKRTYEADNRLNYTSWQWRNVWSSYRWSVWTWNWSDASARTYLCFVNNSWYAMRLMNWNPNWTE